MQINMQGLHKGLEGVLIEFESYVEKFIRKINVRKD